MDRERSEHDPRLRAARYRDERSWRALAAQGEAAPEADAADASDASDASVSAWADAAPASSTPVDTEAVARTAVERAIAAGAFDDLAYAGKPLPDVVGSTDPEWWTKALMRREEVHATEGGGPEALVLRVVDAGLNDELDTLAREGDVRAAVEDFNRRVIEARRQLLGGPPVITPPRDVELELAAWSERRARRVAAARAQEPPPPPSRRGWLRRR